MTEQAAQDPNMPVLDEVVIEPQAEPTEPKLEGQAEPAAAPVEESGFVETESDKIQKRINKITAEKYAEKRRADEAVRKLTEQQAQAPQANQSTIEPKLEDFDFDDAAHTAALIDFKVNQKALEIQQAQQQQVQQQEQQATHNNFQQKVVEFEVKAADYQQVVAAIPQLPPETLDAVMQSDKGPELAYYLGKHLDVADEIATMNPMAAAMKLGQISAQLTAIPKTVAPSAAPDPIEPVGSGGISSKSQEDMSMDEIMNL